MDIYKVIEDHVISQMTPVIDLTLIETVSAGRYKLHSCNTEWATIGDTITIDSIDYLIVEFVINEYLIVTGPSLPVQLYFQLSAPTFEYGNHRKVAVERDKQKDKRTITPMIYMMLVRNNRVKDYDSAYSFDGDARFFFLGTYNEKKDDIDTHQQEVIEPMRAMAKYFREKWNEREDIFEQITECAEQDWMNFGSPQIWGNNPRIFDENLSGVENAFTILSTAEEDCCQQIVSLSCLPVTLSLDTDVVASIASGDSYNITLKDQDGNPVTWSYNAPLKTLTVQTGGSCDPVTFTFNGDTITPTPSGEAKAILFKNSAGTNLGVVTTDTVNTFEATASDITKTDSDGTVSNVPAGVNVFCTPASGGVEQIGYVVNDDFSTVANLNNYDLVATGTVAYNLNGGYLKVSGTPASISPITTFAKYKHSIALEKYGLRFVVVPKTETIGANESVVWGIEADIVSGMPPGNVRKELFYWYRNPSAPTITGKIYRSINNGTGAQFVTTAVAPIVDHRYEILMFLMFNQLMITIKDITPGFENEQGETVAFTYANTTGTLTPRSSRLFIGTGGGEHWFESFQIVSTDLKGGPHLVIHDSLGDGYCTDYLIQRWLDIHRANNPELVIMKSGRQGDWPSSAVLRMDEFAILKGANTTVHLHIGTNQVITSGPGPAFTSYQQLVNGLIALGYTTFVHYYAFPRGGSTAINTYNASILSTYGALAGHTVVDTNTPFNNGSNSLLPQYAATDNIHLNAGAGQRKMAELTSPYFV